MKKFVVGMVIGTIVGTAISVTLEAYGLAKLAIEDGVDLSGVVLKSYEEGKKGSVQVINSWRRKYSTPERRR